MIAGENVDATEEDYQNALYLSKYVEDPIHTKHRIWCSAVLRDDWQHYNVNAPLETLQNYMFYKLVELCMVLCKYFTPFPNVSIIWVHWTCFLLSHILDDDLDDFMPSIDELMEAYELGELTESKSYQFLLKMLFEYFHETYKKISN